ncbi:predicted protein [Chaetomium globosum CBS 148.51]|uniref:Uncharacterized protein n=1 Tax=Chaetomium globosum (strain ATCC 6205 / CBS 148.51 / DSM 1962 / NBRC 6347 / NRRL 1970) TaxID=306901 RepID=Q2H3F6_CHAGB|nr:uncharacterized protein CHGG_06809 [Chaetomium globosum CBS 148.51]EAQ90190.1 predicted protein [Chaetomium globosum CBS 148.51]
MPTTRRSKRARADTNGDAVDPLSSGVGAESLSYARPKRIRVLTKKASPIKPAARRPSTVRKAAKRHPPTKKAAPTKKTPRIVVRNTTEIPSEMPESEYNVEEEEEPPARVQQRQPKLIIRGSSVISESQSGIDGVIVDPFNGHDDVDDDIVFTGAQSKPHNPPRPTTKNDSQITTSPPERPFPPPLPKSIFVKIQRDVKWFRSQYLSTFKILPPVPSRYLRRQAIKVESDIAMFNIAPRSPSSVSRIDFDSLMSQMIETGGTEFELTLEFEFELEPPINNDDLVVAASPTPIRGFSTPVLAPSRTSGSRPGRAGAQLPRGVSATPISNRGTPKAPSTRKSTSNTMAEEMYRRYEADIAKSRTDGVVTTRLVFDELHFRWKCDLGSKCKNFRNGAPATWCWREPGDQKHHPLTNQDLQVWATAIRDGKTTKDNPPVQFHRKWREAVEQQEQQQAAKQSVTTLALAPPPPGAIWGTGNSSYPPPSTGTIADPLLPQWLYNTSASSYPSRRAVTLDIPIRSSSPAPAPPTSKTMAELINEFARQFARQYLMGAYNEQARTALNAVKHRLIEEGHSLVALKALPETFFQECGLPGFLVAPLRGLVKTFLKDEVELATLDEGEYQQDQPIQPSSTLLSPNDPYGADSLINTSSHPAPQLPSDFLQSTNNEGDDDDNDEVSTASNASEL